MNNEYHLLFGQYANYCSQMSSCCDEKRKNIITAPYLWEKCLSLFVNKRFLILLASLISHKKECKVCFKASVGQDNISDKYLAFNARWGGPVRGCGYFLPTSLQGRWSLIVSFYL